MQAVILMAGRGSRMAKHYDLPKQLLPVQGKPIIEHILDTMPSVISEFVFVVGGPHESTLRDYFKAGRYNGRPIHFAVQDEALGVAHAFWSAHEFVTGRFLGMMSDDIFSRESLEELVRHDCAVLAYEVDDPSSFGVFVTDRDGYLVRAVEKPKNFVSNLASTGAMVMDVDFFNAKVPPSARGEYEQPDVLQKLVRDYRKKIKVVSALDWHPVNDREQLERAHSALSTDQQERLARR